MKNINTHITTAIQSRIAMPTYAFGVSVCAGVDAPARKRVALFEGATQGTTVWSSPPS